MSRDAHRELLAALTDYLGPLDDVIAKTRDWASATFVGMRHELSFTCAADLVRIDALPDIDLPMKRHFVADLRIISVERDDVISTVTLEVLTIADA